MFGKYTLLVGLVLTVALVSTGYGQTVIGDFEDPIDILGRIDGWELWSSAPAGTTISNSTNGATLNDQSLRLDVTHDEDGDSWQLVMYTKLQDLGLVDDFFANDILSMDLTRLVADWPLGNGWGSFGMIVNAGGGPEGSEVATWSEWLELGDANVWWNPDVGDNTTTASFDYSSVRDTLAGQPDDVWWLEFVMYTNFDVADAFPGGGTHYFDNVQLSVIPEPTTMAMLASLLAFGGLALLRRKRAC